MLTDRICLFLVLIIIDLTESRVANSHDDHPDFKVILASSDAFQSHRGQKLLEITF